jgi:hypothetical protein
MKSLMCGALFLMLARFAGAQSQIILDTDFGVPGKAFEEIIAAKGIRITGSLPEGWGDNTGWKSNVVAEYRLITEDGRRFLRVQQTSGDGLQFTHRLPGMEKENGYYRLTFTARSLTGVSLGVRDVGVPYSTRSSFTPATDGQWQDFSYDFRLSRHPQEIGLFIYLAGNGTLDLQKLKLIKLSEQDLIAEIKANYPQAGSGNLVNVSTFPLGLQSGWSIDRDYSDGDQVQVDSDAAVPGPSGCSALRIDATVKGIRVYSAPFAVPWSFETHVLSVSVRGNWRGKLIVAGGHGQVCAELPLALSGDQWNRVELPFKPILFAPSHTLRVEGKGTLWLDGLQVEHAAKATAYAPQKPMEISLALPVSDAASARVQFADEPTQVRFAVVGKVPGAVLQTRLVTMYGDEKLLPPRRPSKRRWGRLSTSWGECPSRCGCRKARRCRVTSRTDSTAVRCLTRMAMTTGGSRIGWRALSLAARPMASRTSSCTQCTATAHSAEAWNGLRWSPPKASCIPRPRRTARWRGCWRTRTSSNA